MKNFLKSFVTPKWKRSDVRVRLEAVREMDTSDVDVLEEIALTDDERNVRVAACMALENVPTLRRIASSSQCSEVKPMAANRANAILRERVFSADDWTAALADVSNQLCIGEILLKTDNVELRAAATERLTDHDVIMTVLTGECGKDSGMKLLELISLEDDLDVLAAKGGNKAVRHAVKRRLEEMRKPADEAVEEVAVDTSEDDLREIAEYAESIRETYNFDGVGTLLEQKTLRWTEIDPELKHPLYPKFKEAVNVFDTRRADFETKQAAKKQHDLMQRERTEEKEAVIHAVETISATDDNAGSELEALTADWESIPALENDDVEEELQHRFKTLAKTTSADIMKLAAENDEFARLETLCTTLETVVEEKDENTLRKNKKRTWKESRWKFLDATPLKQRFETAVKTINDLLLGIDKSNEEARERNLGELNEIVEGVKRLVDAENRRKAGNKVRELQDKWNALDGWDHAKLADELKVALDAFWEKQREFHDEQEWAEWHNKGVKDKLIKVVEATSDEEDPKTVAKIIRAAQKKWKEVGAVPHKVSEDMWQRFHTACDANYERCKEFFVEKEKEREENLEFCLKLCDEAEALSASEDWRSSVKRFREMQQQWKAHGSLPREKADETYARFRTACDAFFSRFGDHREDVDSHREENQTAKDALIEQANALLKPEGAPDDPEPCIALQKEWKQLGPGVKAKDEETWTAFRTACDTFFERLEKSREDNVPAKEKLCDEVEALVAGITDDTSRKKMADTIINLQKRWKDLGTLPKSYKGDASKRFRKVCNTFFDLRRKEYAEMSDERERNLAVKRDLIAKAESFADSEEWRETAAELKNLQAEWKSIGHVPKEHDQEVWQAFRAACDDFFGRRKVYFDKMDNRRHENLVAKEELLVNLQQLIGKEDEEDEEKSESGLDLAGQLQAAFENNFAMAGGGQSAHDEIRRIQEHWKAIGPVPREKNDELWNRYRTLLDRFYGNNRK